MDDCRMCASFPKDCDGLLRTIAFNDESRPIVLSRQQRHSRAYIARITYGRGTTSARTFTLAVQTGLHPLVVIPCD